MRIEDYALVGDHQSAALIGNDGAVDWMYVPRFDSQLAPLPARDARARDRLRDTARRVRVIDFMRRRRQVGNLPQAFSHLGLIEAAQAITTGMKTTGTVAHAPAEAPRVMGLRTAVPAPLGPRENERWRSDAPPEDATPTAGR